MLETASPSKGGGAGKHVALQLDSRSTKSTEKDSEAQGYKFFVSCFLNCLCVSIKCSRPSLALVNTDNQALAGEKTNIFSNALFCDIFHKE